MAVANCGACGPFNYFSNTVSVLLGNGDGTFTTKSTPTVGTSPEFLAVGDFNGDGILDLAVSNMTDNTVTVLLGSGDGTFTTKSTSATGVQPKSVVVADFNADGILDLAVVSWDGTLTVLLGNGDGTFTLKSSISVGTYNIVLVAGDYNGDGIPDLATAVGGFGLTVLLGKGDGTFTTQTSPAPGYYYISMVSGDFNGDGILDLALSSCGYNCGGAPQPVPVLLGNGDGTFTAGPLITFGDTSHGLAAADFNGDGTEDLASVSYDDYTARALLNQITETATATLSNVSVSGIATHQVLASYPGDTNYSSSISSTVPLLASGQQITSISPNFGAPAAFVSITGAGFGASQGNSYVTVGGAVAEVTSWSATSIIIRVPSRAITGNLYVIAHGSDSNGVPFTVDSEPSLSATLPISVTTGTAGTQVTFNGNNLAGAATVTLHGAAAIITSQTASQIQVNVPPDATSGEVLVVVNGITLVATPNFVVTPHIDSISPNYGAPAAFVTITGSNFGATQGYGYITIGGAVAEVTSWSPTSIAIRVPSRATTGNVMVIADGGSSNGVPFTFYFFPAITGFSAASAAVGSPVTIVGANLLDGGNLATVAFNGISATILSDSSTGIQVDVPQGATTGTVTVHVNGDTIIGSTDFDVAGLPVPQISGISPNYGAPAAFIEIAGTNFGATQGGGFVTIGDAPSEVVAWSNTMIVVRVPFRATTSNVVVTAGGGSSNGELFTFYSEPSTTSLSVTSGPGGTAVAVSGDNLLDGGNNASVTFNGTPAAISSDTSGNIEVTVPSGATSGRILVKVNGVTMIGPNDFIVSPSSP